MSDHNGAILLNNLEVGLYVFQLTSTARAEAKDFNTTRSNREGSGTHQLVTPNSSGPGRRKSARLKKLEQDSVTNHPQRAEAQDFNTTRSNREGSGTHQGLVQNGNNVDSTHRNHEYIRSAPNLTVKLVKSSGAIMQQGQINQRAPLKFEIVEPGNYKLLIEMPQSANRIDKSPRKYRYKQK